MAHRDVYQHITDRILEQLRNGVVAWRKPWKRGKACNLISGRPYQGMNALLLSTEPFGSRYWLTFRQARELGGTVRRGEMGTPIIYYKLTDYTDPETDETVQRPYLRSWTVFNVEQCDGVDYPTGALPTHPIDEAQRVIAAMPTVPDIRHDGGARAYYRPATDTVHMPTRDSFDPAEAYFATLFHELAHSTGHASRLSRPGIVQFDRFGSQQYGAEELIAEVTAAMLCGVTGIAPTTLDNSAAYLQSWMTAIEADPKLLITSASQAQRAADFILGVSDESTNEQPDVA